MDIDCIKTHFITKLVKPLTNNLQIHPSLDQQQPNKVKLLWAFF